MLVGMPGVFNNAYLSKEKKKEIVYFLISRLCYLKP
jgi:hypothetical protein